MRTRSSRRTIALLVAATCLAASGCVWRERREVVEARRAYHDCVEAYSAEDPACQALQAELDGLNRTYEERARRAWSCDPAQTECPTQRER